MAYKNSYAKEEVIGEVQLDELNKVKVTVYKDEKDVVQALDIRKWYCEFVGGDFNPTKIGFRFKSAAAIELFCDTIAKVFER